MSHIVVAAKPAQPIDKGLPGPGLLAHVITSKYSDHLPLHRQEAMLGRHGVELARSTLADWMAASAELQTPLYKLMLAEALKSRVVQTDETRVPVLQPGQTNEGGPTRGFLQADAANVFDGLYRPGDIIEVACWAHARRYFHEARETDAARSAEALTRIRDFYRVEGDARDLITRQQLVGDAADAVR